MWKIHLTSFIRSFKSLDCHICACYDVTKGTDLLGEKPQQGVLDYETFFGPLWSCYLGLDVEDARLSV